MDNAAYHKCLPEKYCDISKKKKSEILSIMTEEGIDQEGSVNDVEAR